MKSLLLFTALCLVGCADLKVPPLPPTDQGPKAELTCEKTNFVEIVVYGPSCIPGYEHVRDWNDGMNDYLICGSLTATCPIDRRLDPDDLTG